MLCFIHPVAVAWNKVLYRICAISCDTVQSGVKCGDAMWNCGSWGMWWCADAKCGCGIPSNVERFDARLDVV